MRWILHKVECVDNQYKKKSRKMHDKGWERNDSAKQIAVKNVKKVDWQMRKHKVFIFRFWLLVRGKGFFECFLVD